MITDLNEGDWIEYRYRNEYQLARVVIVGGEKCQLTGVLPAVGATIHRGVWKPGDRFEVRKIYVLREAPCRA